MSLYLSNPTNPCFWFYHPSSIGNPPYYRVLRICFLSASLEGCGLTHTRDRPNTTPYDGFPTSPVTGTSRDVDPVLTVDTTVLVATVLQSLTEIYRWTPSAVERMWGCSGLYRVSSSLLPASHTFPSSDDECSFL